MACAGAPAAPDVSAVRVATAAQAGLASTSASSLPGDLAASVSFEPTGDADFPLAMYQQALADGGAKLLVDRFEHSGGNPRIEDTVVLPFRGEEHLFVIAAWPIQHRGLGTTGTFYEIRAYRQDPTGRLQANPGLARHLDISGLEGSNDGEPSTFIGKDANELRALLQRADAEGNGGEGDGGA